MNNWKEKLEYSLGEREKFDISLLKSIIPGCVSVEKTDTETDKTGIDYVATLRRGATINIDAKTRKADAAKFWKGEAELALEVWSVCATEYYPGKTGWTLNENTNVDYILFTFAPGIWDKFYFIPFQLLRAAFRKNHDEWATKYGVKRQRSEDKPDELWQQTINWTSEAIFVPVSVVMEAVNREMEILAIVKGG